MNRFLQRRCRLLGLVMTLAFAAGGCSHPASTAATSSTTHSSSSGEATSPEIEPALGLSLLPPAADPPVPSAEEAEEGTLVLTLEGCLELALGRNLNLARSRLVPAIRGQDFLLAGEVFEPQAFASLTYQDEDSRSGDAQSGVDISESKSLEGVVGVRKTFETGMRADLAWAVARLESNLEYLTINPSQESLLELQVRQPLLRGFGLQVNRAAIHRAANDRLMADQEVRMTLDSELLGVIRAYWSLVYTAAGQDLQAASLALAEEQIAITQDRLDAGAASPLDLVSAEAGWARQRQELIRSRNAYRKASDQLLLRVRPSAHPDEYRLVILPSTEPDLEAGEDLPSLGGLASAIEKGFEHRPEILMASLASANEQIDLGVARNDRLPTLDAVAGVLLQGLDADRDSAMQDSLSGSYPGWTVGAEMEWLFDGPVRRARWQRARFAAESAEIALRQARAQVLVEVRAARFDLDTARQQLVASRETARLAQEQYAGELDRLKVGASTVFRTDSFRRDLLRAEQSYLQARLDVYLARAQLLAAQGLLADAVFGLLED